MWAGAVEFMLFMRSYNYILLGKILFYAAVFIEGVVFLNYCCGVICSKFCMKHQMTTKEKHNIPNCIGNEKQPIKKYNLNDLLSFQHGLTFRMVNLTGTVKY